MGAYLDVLADVDASEQLIAAAKKHLTAMHQPQANGPLRFHQTGPFTDMYSGHRLVRVGVSYQAKETP